MDIYSFITHLIELIAALSGSYYWLKTKDHSVRPFVWLLWLTVFIETVAMYPHLYGHLDNVYLNWIENSVIVRNVWLYNIYNFFSLILIGVFIIRNTKRLASHKIIRIIIIVYSLFTICYFLITESFFLMSLPYDLVIQTFAIFIILLLYLGELMTSNQILYFYKSHVFYLISAISFWYICLTPLFIFDSYYTSLNEDFILFRGRFLFISNILLYSCYTFAFLYSLWHKRQLVMR